MAKVVFSTDLQQYTGGVREAEVSASNFRSLVTELTETFPRLSRDIITKYSVAIDGAIIQRPMMESFKADSELVFIARIAGG